MFTYEQYMSITRFGMNALGMFLITRGLMVGGVWEPITGLVLSGAPFVWSYIRHSKVGTILATDSDPDVAGVLMKQTAAGRAIVDQTENRPTIVAVGTTEAANVAQVTPVTQAQAAAQGFTTQSPMR